MSGYLTRAGGAGGDGPHELTPQNLPLQTLGAIWDNLPQLLLCALWLNLWLAPALLLAFLGLGAGAALAAALLALPAWVALQRLELGLAAGRAEPTRVLWRAWREFWAPAVRLAAIGLFPPTFTFLLGRALGESDAAVGVLTAGILGSIVVWSVIVLYAMPLLVLKGGGIATVLRDSLALAGQQMGATLGMVALAVLCVLATVYLSSGLLFVLPTLYGMFAANNCRLAAGDSN